MCDFWLDANMRRLVIRQLIKHDLIKYNPEGTLPLAGGGTTDLYVNLRNARDDYRAMDFLSQIYATGISPFAPNRVMEVPHAVTCFTQGICSRLSVPLVSMRDTPKAGRVSDDQIIGSLPKGDLVALVDDVISDGTSKIRALDLCRIREVTVKLFVLVDRDQGWRATFKRYDFGNIEVCAGMNLDHIRTHMRENPSAV